MFFFVFAITLKVMKIFCFYAGIVKKERKKNPEHLEMPPGGRLVLSDSFLGLSLFLIHNFLIFLRYFSNCFIIFHSEIHTSRYDNYC